MQYAARPISKLRSATGRAEHIFLWILTALLLLDVLLGILARYVDLRIVFADELGKYLFVWLCMIGLSAATRDDQHVRLSFIASRMPFSPRFLRATSQILFLGFTLFFFYWSLQLSIMHFQMEKSVMGFRFPMFWFTAALPFGFALTSLRLIQDILDLFRNQPTMHHSKPPEYASEEHCPKL